MSRYPATKANGFLPDIDAIAPEVLARTALAYVCSPSNPQGVVAPLDYLARWIELARRHRFVVAFDECYAEIYGRVPPEGALEAAVAVGGGLERILVFHSLSKRSGGPGLRSGFLAGDAALIRRNQQLVNYGGVAVPYPILAASTALWQDEARLKRFLQAIPLGRIGQPEEVAGLAVFLAGEAGRFCTGGVHVVDGGQTV